MAAGRWGSIMTCFWGHNWPKWSEPRVEQFSERTDPSLPWKPRRLTVQDRTCQDCGEYDIRHVQVRE